MTDRASCAGYELQIGNVPVGVTVEPDPRWPAMWRARSGERLSDMVNLTRAKDAAIAWARPRGLGGTETVTWHRREIAQVTPLTHEMAVPVLAAPPSPARLSDLHSAAIT
jgi:hypothetical protein